MPGILNNFTAPHIELWRPLKARGIYSSKGTNIFPHPIIARCKHSDMFSKGPPFYYSEGTIPSPLPRGGKFEGNIPLRDFEFGLGVYILQNSRHGVGGNKCTFRVTKGGPLEIIAEYSYLPIISKGKYLYLLKNIYPWVWQ